MLYEKVLISDLYCIYVIGTWYWIAAQMLIRKLTLNLKFPTGGCAYGMPWNAKYFFLEKELAVNSFP